MTRKLSSFLFLRLNGAGIISIEVGNKVTVEYEGTLDDGTVFDSSEEHDELLEFEVGAGQVISGFDNAMVGMEVGTEKNITLPPSEAYGEHKSELIQVVPKEHLPEGDEPEEGMLLLVALPDGQQIPAMITEVTDESVTIDLNHPMAGKTLNFKLKPVAANS